jgi:hypothetical protein
VRSATASSPGPEAGHRASWPGPDASQPASWRVREACRPASWLDPGACRSGSLTSGVAARLVPVAPHPDPRSVPGGAGVPRWAPGEPGDRQCRRRTPRRGRTTGHRHRRRKRCPRNDRKPDRRTRTRRIRLHRGCRRPMHRSRRVAWPRVARPGPGLPARVSGVTVAVPELNGSIADPPGNAVSPTSAVIVRKVAMAPVISAPETAPPSRYGRIRSNASSLTVATRPSRSRPVPTMPPPADTPSIGGSGWALYFGSQASEAVRSAPAPFDDTAPSTASAAISAPSLRRSRYSAACILEMTSRWISAVPSNSW